MVLVIAGQELLSESLRATNQQDASVFGYPNRLRYDQDVGKAFVLNKSAKLSGS